MIYYYTYRSMHCLILTGDAPCTEPHKNEQSEGLWSTPPELECPTFKAQALGKAAERPKSPRQQMTPRKYFLDTTGWMHTQTQKDWDRKGNIPEQGRGSGYKVPTPSLTKTVCKGELLGEGQSVSSIEWHWVPQPHSRAGLMLRTVGQHKISSVCACEYMPSCFSIHVLKNKTKKCFY